MLRVEEAELDAGGNGSGGIAKVVADATMDYVVDGVPLGNEQIDDIGKLHLLTLTRLDTAKSV